MGSVDEGTGAGTLIAVLVAALHVTTAIGCAAGVSATAEDPDDRAGPGVSGTDGADGSTGDGAGEGGASPAGTAPGASTPPGADTGAAPGAMETGDGASNPAGSGAAGASSGTMDPGTTAPMGPTDSMDSMDPAEPADPCAIDSDGDSLGDCDEADDGDDFTDPNVFNGVHVQTRSQSDNDITCGMIDSLGEVIDAVRGSPAQELDQYAGWDFDDAGSNRTDAGYGFQPPWTDGDSSWQIDAVGHVKLEDGHHCFEVAGETDESCGTLFFSETPSDTFAGWDGVDGATMANAQHGSGVTCVQLAAGVYPIRWHYEMDNRSGAQSMHLRYCYAADADCTPTDALPARILRVTP